MIRQTDRNPGFASKLAGRAAERAWWLARATVVLVSFVFSIEIYSQTPVVSMGAVTSGSEGDSVTIRLDSTVVADSTIPVFVRIEFTDNYEPKLFDSTSHSFGRTVHFTSGNSFAFLTLFTVDNDIVEPTVTGTVTVLPDTRLVRRFTVDEDDDVGRFSVEDDDYYVIYAEHDKDSNPGSVTEGDDVDLRFTRCSSSAPEGEEVPYYCGAEGQPDMYAPAASYTVTSTSDTRFFDVDDLPSTISFALDAHTADVAVSTQDDDHQTVNGQITVVTADDSERADQNLTVTVQDNDKPFITLESNNTTAQINEGADLLYKVVQSKTDLFNQIDTVVFVGGHLKVFPEDTAPGYVRVTIPQDSNFKYFSAATDDDLLNEGDGQVVAHINASDSAAFRADNDAKVNMIVKDNDIPVVSISAENTRIIETHLGVVVTVSRDRFFENNLYLSTKLHHEAFYPEPYENATLIVPKTAFGQPGPVATIGAGNQSHINRSCGAAAPSCLDGNVVGPLGGFSSYEILPFPDDDQDERFTPRYTVGAANKVRVDIENAAPGVKITRATNEVFEGSSVKFDLTRFGGSASTTYRQLRVNVLIEQTGSYVSHDDLKTHVVTFGSRATEASLTIATIDDEIVEGSGRVTATLQPGANTDLVEDDYEYRTDEAPDGTHFNTESVVVYSDDRYPSLSANDATASESDAAVIFDVVLNREPVEEASVDYSVSSSTGDTATASSDYTPTSGTLVFERGTEVRTINVLVTDDNVTESDETFTLSFSNPQKLTLYQETARGTITDNDGPATAIALSVTPAEAAEDSGSSGTSITATATLNGASLTKDVPVTLSLVNGTASSSDYAGINDVTITISSGQTSGSTTFAFHPTNDDIDESDETVAVRGATNETTSTGTAFTLSDAYMVIKDDDTRKVSLSHETIRGREGSSGSYTVVLESEPTADVTITPSQLTRISVSPTSLVFDSGNWKVAQSLTMTFLEDDDEDENYPTITHQASGGDYDGISVPSLAVSIVDNDTNESNAVNLRIADANVTEGDTKTFEIAATLDGSTRDSDTTVTVIHVPSLSTASSSDFTAFSSLVITIPADQLSGTGSLELATLEDAIDEDNETIALSGTTNVESITVPGAYLTIVDDDTRGISLSDTSLAVTEGSSGSYTVELNSQPTADVTVSLTKTGSARVTIDKTSLTFTPSNWSEEQTVTASGTPDIDAANESATISHTVDGGDYDAVSAPDVSILVDDIETPSTKVTLSVNPASVSEGESQSVTVTATLNETFRISPTVVNVSVGAGFGTASSTDYRAVTDFNITIPVLDTQASSTFILATTEDSLDEEDETVSVRGSTPGLTVVGTSVQIADDDARGVAVSKSNLPLDEGDSGSYTVVLESQPTANVTITLAVNGDPDITLDKQSLTFTTGDWGTEQTVTVSSRQDDDAANDSATISHSVKGGDYGLEAAGSVTVTVDDDEEASTSATLTINTDSVNEGDSVDITVTATLNGAAFQVPKTIGISVGAGTASASDFQPVSTFNITIPADSLSASAAFTLATNEDYADESNETVTIGGSAPRLDITGATVTIVDDDTRGVEISKTSLTFGEGESDSYTVVLATRPTSTVTVTLAKSGDAHITINKTSLTFSTGNWNTAQSISVSAAQDLDAVDDSATIEHTVAGGDYDSVSAANVSVSVDDDETASTGVILTVDDDSVDEGDSQSIEVTATLNGAILATATTVSVSVSAGTASSDDFTAVDAFDITIPANTQSGSGQFTLTTEEDEVDENGETVAVTGSSSGLTVTATTVTIEDDDTRGVSLSRTTLPINEGESGTYTVVLDTKPTAAVTVELTKTGDPHITASPASLAFLTDNWGTAQTVTVSAAEDTDAVNDTATIKHTVSGGDYTSVTAASVSVTATDNETASTGVTLSVDDDSVDEGDNANIRVTATLNGAPLSASATVTVSVGHGTTSTNDFTAVDDFDITIAAGSLSSVVSFTLPTIEDAVDEVDETVAITGSSDNLSVTGTTVTIADDDTRGVAISKSNLEFDEGGSDTYTVVLKSQPTSSVTVTLGLTGDTDITANKTSLSFATGTWNTAQTVTVSAAQDTDAVDDEATIAHTVTGGDYATVTAASVDVTVDDDEMASTGLTLTVDDASVNEGEAATITVTATLDEAVRQTATTVSVSVAGNTASTDDFTAVNDFDITIDAGSEAGTGTFTLTTTEDDVDETDETVSVTGSTADLTVTAASIAIADDDTRGVAVSESSLSIDEGGNGTYTVVLESEPTTAVTVTIAPTGDADVTVNKTSLEFTTETWSTAQIVTVSSAQDTDAADDEATIKHTVTGGDYTSETASSVTVSVDDDETATTSATLSVNTASVSEGESAEITVTATLDGAIRLSETVVSVSVGGGTASTTDFSAVANFNIRIPAQNQSATGSFTFNATQDAIDEDNETVSITGSSIGLTIANTAVTIEDDDTRGVAISKSNLEFDEGGSDDYTVVLKSQPTSSVTVTLTKTGDADITANKTSLSFATGTWNTAQTVTVSAGQDTDAMDDEATIAHTVTGGDYATVTAASVDVTVDDDETASTGLTLTVDDASVNEGEAATITVTATLDEAVRQTATTVSVSVAGNTASTDDFTAVNDFDITIDAGSEAGTGTFTLTTTEDDVDETDETVSVTGSTADLTVTAASIAIADDDTRGVAVSESSLSIDEGGNGTYTVVLESEPTTAVTVTIATTGDADVTVNKTSLEFTTETWSTAQIVTVSSAQDTDAADDEATIKHTVTGGDYASETAANVTVSVDDDETASTGVTLTTDDDSVDEGDNAIIRVTATLNGAPLADAATVTVSVGHGTTSTNDYTAVDDFDITIAAGSLSSVVAFTLPTIEDAVDEVDETVAITGSSDNLSVTGTTVTIADDDTRGVAISKSNLEFDEGGSDDYTVVLKSQPTSSVTVTLTKTGDADITANKTSLSFATGTWNTAQTVTVSAGQDTDAMDDEATIAHTVTGGDYATVTAASVDVTVDDDEMASTGLTLTVDDASVNEGEAATITVTATLDEAVRQTATTVSVSVAGNTASTDDFTAVNDFDITIDAGSEAGTGTFTLTTTEDDVDETDETVSVTGSAADLTVTAASIAIADDDTRGVAVSESSLSIDEGGNGTYTVVLESEPTTAVTVTIATTGDADVTVNKTSLEFTTETWSTAQIVTVSSAQDTDAADDEATIKHTVTGGDYASETAANVTVSVDDFETASTEIVIEIGETGEQIASNYLVEEGDSVSAVISVALDETHRLTDTVVTIAVKAGTASTTDFTAVADFELTIPGGSTSATASIVIATTEDAIDENDETILIEGSTSASGLTINAGTITIADDDDRGVALSKTSLDFAEGSNDTYTVVLESQPTSDVDISLARTGDTNITVNKTSLAFSTDNWGTEQIVTVSAAHDIDAVDDTATIKHTVSGGDYALVTVASVSVSVDDDETASSGVTLTTDDDSVDEGDNAIIRVTATLNGAPLADAATVTVSVGHGTSSTNDYTAVDDFDITIEAGETAGTGSFTLTTLEDDVDEADETVSVTGTATDLTVASTAVTIEDDDTRGVTVSPENLTITEGQQMGYTVVLDSEPTSTVTVTLTKTGDTHVTVNPASLEFLTDNWATAQTVTVSTAQDTDAVNDSATIAHGVTGGDYATVTAASVSVSVNDDETASTGVTLTTDDDSVDEGDNAIIRVTATLNGAPLADPATVTVSIEPGTTLSNDFTAVDDFDITIPAGSPSAFATFTLPTIEDRVDEADETVEINGSADDLVVTGTTVTIADDDTRGVTVSETSLELNEGASGTYTVVLESQPTATVTVNIVKTGDSDITVNKATLSFTTGTWSTAQRVTVSAGEDNDALNDSATIEHTVTSSGDYASETALSVAVTATDNETVSTGVTLTVDDDSVNEGEVATITVTATLDEAVRLTTTTVSVSVSGNTASTDDFTAISDFDIQIDASSESGTGTFTLTTTDDDIDEENETVSVTGTAADLTITAASITIVDDDTRGVAVSESSLSLDEGGNATYTVVLESEPTAAVTVTVAKTGDADIKIDTTTLEFSTIDWGTAQTVTVSSDQDIDAVDDTATIAHTVTSTGDYATIKATGVSVSVDDDETASAGVTLTVDDNSVDEGDAATITVTATLDGAIRLTQTTVSVAVGGNTATTDDFTAVDNFDITIDAGAESATGTFTFTTTEDDVDETDETVSVSGTTADLTVSAASITIVDDDTRGVAISESSLALTEGGSGNYSVVLESQPTATVTVAIVKTGDSHITANTSSLEFLTDNWGTAQTVTVTAAEDDDAVNDTATFAHTVEGGDYVSETASSVLVTATDNETASTGVSLTVDDDSVDEGDEATITVTATLNGAIRVTQTTVSVSVGGNTASTDDFTAVDNFDITIDAGSEAGTGSFTLTTTDDDIDEEDETVSVTGTATDLTVSAASIAIVDDDTRGVAVSESSLSINEGGNGTYTVVLKSQPTAAVTVTLEIDGDVDITANKASLSFSTSTWSTAQTVTVSAAQDRNAVNDSATIAHEVFGGDYAAETAQSVSVSVDDDETVSKRVKIRIGDSDDDVATDYLVEEGESISVVVAVELDETHRTLDTVIAIAVNAGTASTSDFTAVEDFEITIPAGSDSATGSILIATTEDFLDEDDETILLEGSTSASEITVETATVTITDDDDRGVALSKTSLTLNEGANGTYTVVLESQPTAAVTVTLVKTGDADITVNETSLEFATDTWDAAQTVTVSAAEDRDAENDTATIAHTVAGGDYESEPVSSLGVTATDNETASTAVTLTVDDDEVDEGEAATITVTATLDGAIRLTATTVAVSVGADTASTDDFTAVDDFEVTIEAGADSGTGEFTLTTLEDEIDEPDEAVSVTGTADDLTVTGASIDIVDDDTRGVSVSESSLSFDEGDSGTYTVVLLSQPTSDVTISLARTGDTHVTVLPVSLSFGPGTWSTEQTVTVSAAEDDDAVNDSATIAHTVQGGDYTSTTAANVMVSVTDNETASSSVALSVDDDAVDEGDAETITVTATLDSAILLTATTVSVSVSGDSASTDDFTEITDFEVTIEAGEQSGTGEFTLTTTEDDVDETDETVTVSGSVTDLTVDPVTVTIVDDDTRGVTVLKESLTITEGLQGDYEVVLDSEPTETVTVTLTKTGDADITANKASLTFLTGNWSTAQTVTVSAAEDRDAVNDIATIEHTIAGGDYASVAAVRLEVTATDNETASTGLALSIDNDEVDEGASVLIEVTATLNGAVRIEDTSVVVTVGDGTATAGDYTAVEEFTITIPANDQAASASFTLEAIDDELDELDETVVIAGSATDFTVTEVTATIIDDDTRGVTMNPTALAFDEGESGSYTIVLDSQPSSNVTMTLAMTGDDDVTLNKTTLDFTSSNWETEQRITVSAAQDLDAVNDEATVQHSVTGGDYESLEVSNVAVDVEDDETESTAVTLTVSSDTVDEGSTESITVTATLNNAVRLSATVVSVQVDADTASTNDFTAVSDFEITIPANAQSGNAIVELITTQDFLDEDAESIDVTGTVLNMDVVSTTITINDDDTRGVTLSRTSITTTEGLETDYSIVLDSQPTELVTLTLALTGDSDISVNATTIEFSTANWNEEQEVTIIPAEDIDAVDDSATIAHAVSGGDYEGLDVANVSVLVSDNETSSTAINLVADPTSVSEGDAETVTVTASLNGAVFAAATPVTISIGADSASIVDFDEVEQFDITIPSNSPSATGTFTLTTVDDDVDEGDETVSISGVNPDLTVNGTTIAIADDDTRGVHLDPDSLTLAPGESDQYAVSLESEPSAPVVVTVEPPEDWMGTVTPSSLDFTRADWNETQNVLVVVSAEAEKTGLLQFNHSTTGGDYDEYEGTLLTVVVEEQPAESIDLSIDLSVDPERVTESSGSTDVTVTATFVGTGRIDETNITVSIAGDSAIDADFEAVSDFTLTIPADAQSATVDFTFTPVDDQIFEASEAVSVSGVSGDISINSTALYIDDNDTRGVTVTPTELSIEESATASYTLQLLSEPTGSVTITTIPDPVGSIRIEPVSITFDESNWDSASTVSVTGVADTDAVDETISIGHSASGVEYTNIAIDSVDVTVVDTDVRGVTVTPTELEITENDQGSYRIKLDTEPSGPVRVSVATRSTALLSVSPSTLTFNTSTWNEYQTVSVDAEDDADLDDEEDIRITHEIMGADYSNVSVADVVVLIVDDDLPPSIQIMSAEASEETENLVFGVSLSHSSSSTITLDYATVDVMAKSGEDYEATSGSLTFDPGVQEQTVSVRLIEDALDEDDETFALKISNITNGRTDQDSGTGTILDNDEMPTVSIADAVAKEGDGYIDFVARLSAPSGRPIYFLCEASAGTATPDEDFIAGSLRDELAPGDMELFISVPLVADNIREGDETIHLELLSLNPAVVGNASAVGTILDDDDIDITQRWIANFGQVVANQIVEAVANRVTRRSEDSVLLSNQDPPTTTAPDTEYNRTEGRLGELNPLQPNATGKQKIQLPRNSPLDIRQRLLERNLRFSFGNKQLANAGSGVWHIAGNVAKTRFEEAGDIDPYRVNVSTEMLSADFEKDGAMVGLLLTSSTGDGSYLVGAVGDNFAFETQFDAKLQNVVPYARFMINDDFRVWGSVGLGTGSLPAYDENSRIVERDLEMRLGSLGTSMALNSMPRLFGMDMNAYSDVYVASIEVPKALGLMEYASDLSQLRVFVEGSKSGMQLGSGHLSPSVDIGIRYEDGDGRTGAGLGIGGKIQYANPNWGLSVESAGRTIVWHAIDDYQEWNLSHSVTFSPSAAGNRATGPSVKVTSTQGTDTTNLQSLIWNSSSNGSNSREYGIGKVNLKLEFKYGLYAFDERALLTPFIGVSLLEADGRLYRIGTDVFVGPRLTISLLGERVIDITRTRDISEVALRARLRLGNE